MALTWKDDLDAQVYISTSGDFVSLGDRREYPFEAGGSGGVPLSWSPFFDNNANPANFNMSVGLGRFNISNALPTDAQGGWRAGASRDFPAIAGHRYIFQIQARNIEGKSSQGSKRYVRYQWLPSGSPTGTYGAAQDEWEQISIPMGPAPAGTTGIRMMVQALTYMENNIPPDPNWGVQFQNFALVDQLQSYPAPTWQEISCDVRSLQSRYGRDKFTARYDVASMQLALLNNDGEFTFRPNDWLRPGRFIKVTLTIRGEATVYDHYYGIIDSLGDSYTLDGSSYTVIQAVDISSLLSNMTVPTASWDENTYLSDSRFRRLLDAVGWRQQTTQGVGLGKFYMQPILANGRTVRDELGLIADSEGGYFYADRTGNLLYQNRDWDDDLRGTHVTAELMAQPEPEPPPPVHGLKFQFPNQFGNNLSTPDSASYFMPGDVDIRVRVNPKSVTAEQTYVSKYQYVGASGPNYFELLFGRTAPGRINFYALGYSRTSTENIPFGAGQAHWLRATAVAATGVRQYFWAPDSEYEPQVWTKLGNDSVTPAAANVRTPIPLYIGQGYGTSASTWRPTDGRIHQVIFRNGVNGPKLLDVSDRDASYEGQLAFTGETGQPWTVTETAQNIIVQDDTTYPPAQLPITDNIPNLGDPPLICIRELQPSWSRDRVVNEVTLANQGGNAITTVDAESQQKYGPRTYQRLDLLNVNDHPEYLTIRTADIMDGYTDAVLRINTVQFKPTRSDRSYKWALTVFLNQLVRVRYTHPTNGWGFSVVSHVQGIEHSFTLNEWVCTLMLDNPEAYNYWQAGETDVGWDVALWDVGIWDHLSGEGAFWNSGQKWDDPNTRWGF